MFFYSVGVYVNRPLIYWNTSPLSQCKICTCIIKDNWSLGLRRKQIKDNEEIHRLFKIYRISEMRYTWYGELTVTVDKGKRSRMLRVNWPVNLSGTTKKSRYCNARIGECLLLTTSLPLLTSSRPNFSLEKIKNADNMYWAIYYYKKTFLSGERSADWTFSRK